MQDNRVSFLILFHSHHLQHIFHLSRLTQVSGVTGIDILLNTLDHKARLSSILSNIHTYLPSL